MPHRHYEQEKWSIEREELSKPARGHQQSNNAFLPAHTFHQKAFPMQSHFHNKAVHASKMAYGKIAWTLFFLNDLADKEGILSS
jgi:hypothetical protein